MNNWDPQTFMNFLNASRDDWLAKQNSKKEEADATPSQPRRKVHKKALSIVSKPAEVGNKVIKKKQQIYEDDDDDEANEISNKIAETYFNNKKVQEQSMPAQPLPKLKIKPIYSSRATLEAQARTAGIKLYTILEDGRRKKKNMAQLRSELGL